MLVEAAGCIFQGKVRGGHPRKSGSQGHHDRLHEIGEGVHPEGANDDETERRGGRAAQWRNMRLVAAPGCIFSTKVILGHGREKGHGVAMGSCAKSTRNRDMRRRKGKKAWRQIEGEAVGKKDCA